MQMNRVLLAAAAALWASSAMASPIYTFSLSAGSQPSNVGTITLTQNGANSVNVSVDLAPSYGFLNSGGPHTPFAFNLDAGAAPTITAFTTPLNGVYANGVFSLDTGGGAATPYGSFGVALDDSAGNGSSKAYYGDLLFTLTRSGGLTTDDFVTNGVAGYYFAADLTNGLATTGSQAWQTRTVTTTNNASVPEPATIALFGMGLFGMAGAVMRRRKAQA
jgi:hypothetical protein